MMDAWLAFVGTFLLGVGGLVGPSLAGSVLAGRLKDFFSGLRARNKDGELTPDAIQQALQEHFPDIAGQLDKVSVRGFEIQQDVTGMVGQLGEISESIRRFERTRDTDQDAVKYLTNRFHELTDGLQSPGMNEDLLKTIQEIRLRFTAHLPPRFTVIRDLDEPDALGRVMRALDLHPEKVYLKHLVERKVVLDEAEPKTNTLITGLPGAGKTTLMHQIMMRDRPEAVVVVNEGFGRYADHVRYLVVEDLPPEFTLIYDNVQWNAEAFRDAVVELRQTFPAMRFLCACRSTDLQRVSKEIAGFREGLKIGCEVEVPPLDHDEAGKVVALCERSWDIKVEDRLRDWLVKRGSKAYATPFYFISLLAPVRASSDRTAHLADVVALVGDDPDSAPAIWRTYFNELDPKSRDLLRTIRMVNDMHLPTDITMVSRLAEGVFGQSPVQQREARERLKNLLWLSVTDDGKYSCYDIQIEAVELEQEHHDTFVEWALDFSEVPELRLTLLNQGGVMEYNRHFGAETAQTRAQALKAAAKLWEAGVASCDADQEGRDRAGLLNNVSNCCSDLAAAAESVEDRRRYLQQALGALEQAIAIQHRLNLPADLAMSLNNASNLYSELAPAAQSVEERRRCLQQAVEAVEEAAKLYRRLNLPADLAMSLNNASNRYSDLAGGAESVEERRGYFQQAVESIEEAGELYRRLNLPAELAGSLNNASNCYSALAGAAESVEERRGYLRQAVETIEEAIAVRRRLDLPAKLASSLNNASNHYSALAGAAESVEERRGYLQQAIGAIEEAIAIRRRLNLPAVLASSLNNASGCYSDLAEAAESVEERRGYLQQAVTVIEEAIAIPRRLDLPANLADSLTNASNCYSALAAAAEGVEERRGYLQQAVETIEEAIELYRRLNLPADLAMSLGAATSAWQVLARHEENEVKSAELQLRAGEFIDEAIGLFEQTGESFWLVRAYPHGVRVHIPLMSERPESLAKVKQYAQKAVPLLRAYGKDSKAGWLEELIERLE